MADPLAEKVPPDKDKMELMKSNPDETNNLTYNSYNIKYYKYGDTGPFLVIVESPVLDVASMHPIKFGRKLQTANINGIQYITKKGKNRVGIEFYSLKSANTFIDSNFLKSENLHAFIPNSLVTSRGVVRGMPEDMSVEEIIQSAKSPQKVVHTRRINRRVVNEDNTIQYAKTGTVILTFERKKIPKHVDINYYRIKVHISSNPM
nr:unnamed protein product [Callosobruchus analis]